MTPVCAVKNGVRYRYCISSNLNQGDRPNAAKLNRVPAVEIETLVIAAVRKYLGEGKADRTSNDGKLLRKHISKLTVKPTQMLVSLRVAKDINASDITTDPTSIILPWSKRPSKMPRDILRPVTIGSNHDPRPIRSGTRVTLIRAIATGRAWLAELVEGRAIDVQQIAAREKCSVRQVNAIVSLAFLAPDLVQAAVEGRMPHGIKVKSLRSCPADWHQQRVALGLAS